jgi:hypothetical protein
VTCIATALVAKCRSLYLLQEMGLHAHESSKYEQHILFFEGNLMFPESVFEERLNFIKAVSEVSPDYLKDKSNALFTINAELMRSLTLEQRIILSVKRLDVTDKAKVSEFRNYFQDYVDSRSFYLERTRCSQIYRIYKMDIISLNSGTLADRESVNELDRLLRSFGDMDRGYTEEIELVMDKALMSIIEIDRYVSSGQTLLASQKQTDFVKEYEPELKRLKDTISKMSKFGNELVEKMES